MLIMFLDSFLTQNGLIFIKWVLYIKVNLLIEKLFVQRLVLYAKHEYKVFQYQKNEVFPYTNALSF